MLRFASSPSFSPYFYSRIGLWMLALKSIFCNLLSLGYIHLLGSCLVVGQWPGVFGARVQTPLFNLSFFFPSFSMFLELSLLYSHEFMDVKTVSFAHTLVHSWNALANPKSIANRDPFTSLLFSSLASV